MAVSHDRRFKSLLRLRRILRDFFGLFLPEVAAYIDFSKLHYADKERETLHGRGRSGDLVVRRQFLGSEAAFVIHLEHEARKDGLLVERMLEYFALDWREFRVPVYPVLVLSGPASGRGLSLPARVRFPDRRVLEFDFAVIDLAGMDGSEYVKKPNLAGLARRRG